MATLIVSWHPKLVRVKHHSFCVHFESAFLSMTFRFDLSSSHYLKGMRSFACSKSVCFCLINIPLPTKWYIGITLSVHPPICLSTGETQHNWQTWRCAWRVIIPGRNISKEIISSVGQGVYFVIRLLVLDTYANYGFLI